MEKTQNFEEGPFLEAALICEKVLREIDQVKSIIRIVDRFTKKETRPDAPAEMKSFLLTFTLYLSFKKGKATGNYQLKLKLQKPTNDYLAKGWMIDLPFSGNPNDGVAFFNEFTIEFDQVGLWWMDVLLNDKRITKIPIEIKYLRPDHSSISPQTPEGNRG